MQRGSDRCTVAVAKLLSKTFPTPALWHSASNRAGRREQVSFQEREEAPLQHIPRPPRPTPHPHTHTLGGVATSTLFSLGITQDARTSARAGVLSKE